MSPGPGGRPDRHHHERGDKRRHDMRPAVPARSVGMPPAVVGGSSSSRAASRSVSLPEPSSIRASPRSRAARTRAAARHRPATRRREFRAFPRDVADGRLGPVRTRTIAVSIHNDCSWPASPRNSGPGRPCPGPRPARPAPGPARASLRGGRPAPLPRAPAGLAAAVPVRAPRRVPASATSSPRPVPAGAARAFGAGASGASRPSRLIWAPGPPGRGPSRTRSRRPGRGSTAWCAHRRNGPGTAGRPPRRGPRRSPRSGPAGRRRCRAHAAGHDRCVHPSTSSCPFAPRAARRIR